MFEPWQLAMIDEAGYNGIRQEHIESTVGEIFRILVRSRKARIAAVWLSCQSELHVGYCDVSLPDLVLYVSEIRAEIISPIMSGNGYLALMHHDVAQNPYGNGVFNIDRGNLGQTFSPSFRKDNLLRGCGMARD